jgi:putative transposase
VFFRQGEKALNDQCLPHIERDCSVIEVDDMIVADGHPLNFEILNPWTGKPKRMTLLMWYDMRSAYPLGWGIMPTENTQVILATLRRAILMLGKIPKIAYLDNGKAFRSRFFTGCADFRQAGFTGLFERLGIHPVFAWRYHPESKPVERFFGTMAEIERRAPSYCGTSIEKQPPRMKRGEFLHRAIHEKLTEGRVPTLVEAYQALASWFDDYAGRVKKTGHIKGQKPVDVFLSGRGPGLSDYQQEQLRLLMMTEEVRRIHRDGIKLPWCDERYYAPELYGRTQQSGIVRYDLGDLSTIYVYDELENFICEARRMDRLHPAATVLGTDEDRDRLRARIELRNRLKKETVAPARHFLETEVLPEVRRQMAEIGFERGELPAPVDRDNGDAAGKIVRLPATTRTERSQLFHDITEDELAAQVGRIESYDAEASADRHTIDEAALDEALRIEQLAAAMEADDGLAARIAATPAERPHFARRPDRYRWCVEQDAAGGALTEIDRAFMRDFEAGLDEATAAYWAVIREQLRDSAGTSRGVMA